jgi:hypothetical protein
MPRDPVAENTLVWNGPTVLGRDELHGTRGAVTKHVRRCASTLTDRSHGSLRQRGAQPRQVGGVVVDLDDEPLVSGQVTSAAQPRPVSTGEGILDEEFEVEPTKPQHRNVPSLMLLSRETRRMSIT